MSDDLVSRLAGAQTSDERAWIATQDLLNALPLDLSSGAWAAAIPHWFDADILAELRPELRENARQIYERLQALPFVEVFSERGHNVHELTRRVILNHLWDKTPAEFSALSAQAASYFSRDDRPEGKIEYLYHLAIADPVKCAAELWNLQVEWNNTFLYAELGSLAQVLLEHVDANRIRGRTRAIVHYIQGWATRLAQPSDALDALNKAIQGAEDDQALRAHALADSGDVLKFLDKHVEALSRYDDALEIFRQLGDRLGEANTLHGSADELRLLGKNKLALARFGEVFELFREQGNHRGQANTLFSVANIHQSLNEYNEALRFCEEALTISRAIRDTMGQANALCLSGYLLQILGDNEAALVRYDEALELFRALGYRLGEGNVLQCYGEERVSQKDFKKAMEFYDEAIKIYTQIDDRYSQSNTLFLLAHAQRALNQTASAVDSLVQAAQLAEEIGVVSLRAAAIAKLAEIADEQENWVALIDLLDSLVSSHPDDVELVLMREKLVAALKEQGH